MKYVLERTETNGIKERNVIECASPPRVHELVVFCGTTYTVSAVIHMIMDQGHDWTTREVTVRAWAHQG